MNTRDANGSPVRAGREVAHDPLTSAETSEQNWQRGVLASDRGNGGPTGGGTLTVALEVNPISLNLNADPDMAAAWITRHRVYEGLLRIEETDSGRFEAVPELAESWTLSQDRRAYTFTLRRGVVWHDGAPFTARDVTATFDKIMDPTSKAAHLRSQLLDLESYRSTDDYTVVLAWSKPNALALDTLSDVMVQPAHRIAALSGREWSEAQTNALNRAPLGTGPYRFVRWVNNERVELVRNERYFGSLAHIERLIFRIVGDSVVRLQLAERGEVDLTSVTPDQWLHMKSPELRRSWNRSRFLPSQYVWIGWNQARVFFAEKRVRQALTMLVDRPGIIGKLLFDLPRATTCHFYWAGSQCDPTQPPLPFDPVAAGRLLDEAGWRDSDGDGLRDKEGRTFRFEALLPAAATEESRWANKVKEDFAHAGIGMELRTLEWSGFMQRLLEHNFDACILAWGLGARDDGSQWATAGIRNGSNFVSFSHPEVDQLLGAMREEFDEVERDAIARKVGAILYDEQPYTWMYVRPELTILHKRVRGARPSLFWWPLEKMWIEGQHAK